MTFLYVILAVAIGVGLFNSLVTLRTRVNEAWSDIRVQMKRRYDLIPGLVETVKSYAAHEAGTLREVVEARNVAMVDEGSPESQARSENILQHALKNLFALAEAYPDLQASENFAQLHADLTDTENKIKMSRRFYNGSVRELNIKVEQFPSNIVARMFGFRHSSSTSTRPRPRLRRSRCRSVFGSPEADVTMLARVVALLVLGLALLLGPATAQQADLSRELIRDYWVLVEVGRDGSVTVSEEIEVVALGDQIRRGIYRDIPLGGIGPLNLGAARFEFVAAHRDNSNEPHHIETRWDSLRIYLGSENVLLDPGIYRYRIVYRMSGQVGRFAGFDEIYWNATGNDWSFDIERVRVTVVPPDGAPVERTAAYTGHPGEAGSDVEIARDDAGRPVFLTTRPLRRGERLTIAVG